jgi:hypothetical protein
LEDCNNPEANARLIAAAPALLEALAALLACCVPTGQDTRTDRAMRQARAALALVKGGAA